MRRTIQIFLKKVERDWLVYKHCNNISRTETKFSQTNDGITDKPINIPIIEPITDGIYENILNNDANDHATFFDDDTLSTIFEKSEFISTKQTTSKHKRMLAAIIETAATCSSQKEKSKSNKILKIHHNVDTSTSILIVCVCQGDCNPLATNII